MLKVLIVEDELLAAIELKKMLQKIRPGYIVQHQIQSVEELHRFFKEDNKVDLIFLDIELQDGNSIQKMKDLQNKTPIIYCTAYSQFAIDAFDTHAIGYLLKPFTSDRLLEVIEKFEETTHFVKEKSEINNLLHIQSEYRNVQVSLDDILFIESMNDYVHIHLQGKKLVSSLMSLKKMLDKLPSDKFVRIHRSFIVPIYRIQHVRGKMVSLGYKDLPLGITYENDFYKKYLKENY